MFVFYINIHTTKVAKKVIRMLGSHVLGKFLFLVGSPTYGMIRCISSSTSVEQRLKDQYIQKWQSDIRESSKGQIYNIFKTDFGPEKFLNLLPKEI